MIAVPYQRDHPARDIDSSFCSSRVNVYLLLFGSLVTSSSFVHSSAVSHFLCFLSPANNNAAIERLFQ